MGFRGGGVGSEEEATEMKLHLKQCLPAIIVIVLAVGCAGPAGDAVGRQITIELMARKMVPESERLQIACCTFSDSVTESDVGSSESLPAAEVNITIGKIEDHRPNTKSVGVMFNWSRKVNLVLDEEAGLDTLLLHDLKRIMEKKGISVEEKAGLIDAPAAFIDIEILEAWVESIPAKMNEFRGTIKAIFAFRAIMSKTDTGERLERLFKGESTLKTAYFSRRSHEEALSEAYCGNAMGSFAEFAAGFLHD
jgi:hypothetical protein